MAATSPRSRPPGQQSSQRGIDEVREEVIRGEAVRVPPASKRHDVIKNEICLALAIFLKKHASLRLRAYVQIAYAVSNRDTFVPDVSVLSSDRLHRSNERILTHAPDIAIEVISPADSARHIRSKIVAYLENGARSVWVVYPDEKLIDVHSADGVRQVKGEAPIEDPLLPGFTRPVSSFFAEA